MPSSLRSPGYGSEVTLGGLSFHKPVALVAPPGETNRLFVVEKWGRVMVVTNLAQPTLSAFLDLSARVPQDATFSDLGLLGLAFHPRYAENRYFYVFYHLETTSGQGQGMHQRLARFQTSASDPNKADPASELPLITQRDEDPWHSSGDLHFGPDGYLYVSLGDEGGILDPFKNSQRIDKDFFSGILRIDVDKRPGGLAPNPHPAASQNYAVPAENPFVGASSFHGLPVDPQKVRTEFYAVGLRNPWRFCFDPLTGHLYCNDTGQNYREEVNFILKGGNYGWSYYEGSINLLYYVPREDESRFVLLPPIAEYGRNEGTVITGGILYRGDTIGPLNGAFIFSDFDTGGIGVLRFDKFGLLAEMESLRSEIAQAEKALDIGTPALETAQAVWERRLVESKSSWRILDPLQFASESGATLTRLDDASLLASGSNPATDTYTVTAFTDLIGITAIRLEMLADERLPQNGPGRFPLGGAGGNFALTEFELFAAPVTNSAALARREFQNPSADFNQLEWEIAKSLDGDPATGWAIYPQVGLFHQAVFECKEPLGYPGGAKLTFVLQQNFGSQATIGRFRLSVTTAPLPHRVSVPERMASILNISSSGRTPDQRAQLSAFFRSISPELQSVRDRLQSLRANFNRLGKQLPTPVQWITADRAVSSFGINPRTGDILMANYLDGKIRRLTYNTNIVQEPLPDSLAQTGAFSDLEKLTPHAGIVPYTLNVPFWSDGAEKTRWFSVPATNQFLTFHPTENWLFPAGTVWIKHFELETVKGKPESRRRLETRFLIRNNDGVYGLTYRWDSAQKNAFLLPEHGLQEAILIQEGGVIRTQIWQYPSRSQCLQCHTEVAGYALGFNTPQLNRIVSQGLGVKNQIELLREAGYFRNEATGLNTLPALADFREFGVSLEYRVRSFFHANCVQCHQPGGPGRGAWDARITTPLSRSGLINTFPFNPAQPSDRTIALGSPRNSVLWRRIANFDGHHMPPLATSLLYLDAVAVSAYWITNDLPADPPFPDWQWQYFGSTNSAPSAPDADPDRDGAPNYFEYLSRTSPLERSEFAKLRIQDLDGRVQLHFPRAANRHYEVQWTTNLLDPDSWRPLDVPSNRPFFSAAHGEAIVEDFLTAQPVKYYRFKIHPR